MKQARRKRRPSGVSITWLGHSAFKLTSVSGKTILIDPWLENPQAPAEAHTVGQIDFILVTHAHDDHIGQTIALARETNAHVVAILEVANHIERFGVRSVEGMNKSGTVRLGSIAVTMVDARHSSSIQSEGQTFPGGEAAGYVVRFENGFSVYHAGDTGLFGDMKLIAALYKPDVAILPVGGFYTMGPREAAMACELLNPRHIIGMHYGTFPEETGTPAELRKLLPPRLKSRLTVLTPGAAFTP